MTLWIPSWPLRPRDRSRSGPAENLVGIARILTNPVAIANVVDHVVRNAVWRRYLEHVELAVDAEFLDLGHIAVGLEGAEQFVAMARDYTGCTVWHQDFLALELPEAYFDGIFANASLFHVPSVELPRVLKELRDSLKPSGVLFSSNPRGNDEEGWNRGRYGAYHTLATWRRHLTAAGFVELEHYYRPSGLPREHQAWLASVWRVA